MQKKQISSIGILLLLLLSLPIRSNAQIVIQPLPFLGAGGSSAPVNCISDGTVSLPCYTGSTLNSGIYFSGTSTLISANGVNVATFSSTSFTSVLPILLPNGTAAAPSIAGVNDTNTGLHFPGSNILGMTSGGLGFEWLALDASNMTFRKTGGGITALSVFGDASQSIWMRHDATDGYIQTNGGTTSLKLSGDGGANYMVLNSALATWPKAYQLTEMTAPSAGGANTVKYYSQDNGAGKTQLCALFPSGVAQCYATEP